MQIYATFVVKSKKCRPKFFARTKPAQIHLLLLKSCLLHFTVRQLRSRSVTLKKVMGFNSKSSIKQYSLGIQKL